MSLIPQPKLAKRAHFSPPEILLFAITFTLATGRWGSYIGNPESGLLLVHVLLLLALLPYLFSSLGSNTLDIFARVLLPTFIISNLIRADQNNISFVLKDILPFVYLMLIPGVVAVLRQVTTFRIVKAIRLGCALHLFWYLPNSLGLLPEIYLPWLSKIPIFSERSDLSGVVMGIGILFWSSFPTIGLKSNTTLSLLFLVAAILGRSRAGLIATIFCVAFLSVKIYAERKNSNKKNQDTVTLFVIVTLIMTGFLGAATIGQLNSSENAFSRFGLFGGESNVVTSAKNTGNARYLAAKALIDWTNESNVELFGAGPGAEIVLNSGALRFLSGHVEVRAPHNWWLHLFSRYGFVGLFFWCIFIGVNSFRKNVLREPAAIAASGSILAILISSTFGVILESPFGSIPLIFLISMILRDRENVE